MRRFLSQPTHDISPFYAIYALLTRKKKECQTKQQKAKRFFKIGYLIGPYRSLQEPLTKWRDLAKKIGEGSQLNEPCN
jgi:hypothetical protein